MRAICARRARTQRSRPIRPPHQRTCPSQPRIRRPCLDSASLWAGQSATMRSSLPIVLTLAVVTGGCAIEPFHKDDGKTAGGQAQSTQRPAGSGPVLTAPPPEVEAPSPETEPAVEAPPP